MMQRIWILIVLGLMPVGLMAQEVSTADSLEQALQTLIEASDIPGLGVGIVNEAGIMYSHGFGYADVAREKAYTDTTLQRVASISKPMIGVALMKIVEQGLVSLETNINDILPFSVVNPHYPAHPITLLQLATHTSSITDTDASDNGIYFILERKANKALFPKGAYRFYKKYLKNQELSYPEYLRAYLTPSGAFYRKSIFGKYPPGQRYQYSNCGASLAAYIIELITGQSFAAYTEQHIFQALGMKHSAWHPDKAQAAWVSELYFENGNRVPHYRIIIYPSGGLHSCSRDLGLFLSEIMRGYAGKGSLLKPESYQLMLHNQLGAQIPEEAAGIFWVINPAGTNIGHSGAEIGTASRMVFNPELNRGLIVMVNISSFDSDRLTRDYIQALNTLATHSLRME